MLLHYYLNLPKDKPLPFDTDFDVSQGMMLAAGKSFGAFETYLGNAIRTLEAKEAIKARWEKITGENRAQLSIVGGLYEVPKKTTVKVLGNEKGSYRFVSQIDDPDFTEKLKGKCGGEKFETSVSRADFQNGKIRLPQMQSFGKTIKAVWGFESVELELLAYDFQKGIPLTNANGYEYEIIHIDGDNLTVKGAIPQGEKLFYDGKEISCNLESGQSETRPKGFVVSSDDLRDIIYCEEQNGGYKKYKKIDKLGSFIADPLRLPDGGTLEAERDGTMLLLKNAGDYDKIVTANNIKFRIDNLRKNNNENFRIQLVETDDDGKDDDVQALSPLRYFFSDDISIEDDKKNRYKIIEGRESDYTLILKKDAAKGEKTFASFPPEGSILSVKVNTYPLRKQLHAISALKNMPLSYHAPLIKLFENRAKGTPWAASEATSVTEWYVITDENRSGYNEQREFVNKALGTKDFAVLEGPPGSGKTTVTLELICQLVKQKKRVLLCGSTHVAIDNILERLKEKKDGDGSLLEKFCILPVRIGEESRVNEDVREFQLGRLIEDNGIDQDLLLSASNLVCGTTIGILQHPKFKERKFSDTPVIPEFDCLIIDESSKTTFQEFLVPALYAKKWILAGDVMQLSPFTERGDIVSNIEHLSIDGEPLSRDLQDAVFYLQKMKNCVRYGGNRFVLPVPTRVIENMCIELRAGRMDDFQNKILLFVSSCKTEVLQEPLVTNSKIEGTHDNVLIRSRQTFNFLEAAASDIIFVDENYLSQITPLLPESHAVLRSGKWEENEHAFKHSVYQNRRPFSYREKGKEYNGGFEIVGKINDYFKEKNWAEEVAWRVDREHQLRLIEKTGQKTSYTKQITDLLPKSIAQGKVEEAVSVVAEMAFPSILESLVNGIKGRKTKVESTISEGFKDGDLKKRKTTLTYQHRMHSEISKFPRERFYKGNDALKDLEKPKSINDLRDWGYGRYPSRSVWLDVDGEEYRSHNKKEVDVLMAHLKDFVDYAKNNKQSEGKQWEVACLAFYRRQERAIREKLQAFCKQEHKMSNFTYKDGQYPVNIKLHTVDKFQGHEADVVFLSMVQTKRVGFMDNPNRLNVALTRAKFQLVVLGKRDYFLNQDHSDDLKQLAKSMFCRKG